MTLRLRATTSASPPSESISPSRLKRNLRGRERWMPEFQRMRCRKWHLRPVGIGGEPKEDTLRSGRDIQTGQSVIADRPGTV